MRRKVDRVSVHEVSSISAHGIDRIECAVILSLLISSDSQDDREHLAKLTRQDDTITVMAT